MNADDFGNGKMLGQAVRQESIVVNRAKGLTIELLLATGQVVFSNGEVWTVSQMEIGNLRKGVGTIEGQNIMVHPDGSTIIGSYKGRMRPIAKSNRFAFSGDWVHISGTGRTKGIKGSGEFKGTGTSDKFVADLMSKAAIR
jgi:hypothetical protein